MIGRKRCRECFGTGESLDVQDRPAPCGLCVQAAADGILGRAFVSPAHRAEALRYAARAMADELRPRSRDEDVTEWVEHRALAGAGV